MNPSLPTLRRWCLIIALALPAFLFAQNRALTTPASPVTVLPVVLPANALLTVTPDAPDWTYSPGTPAVFRVHVTVKPYPAAGVPIKYRLGAEMLEGDEKDAIVPEDGLVLTAPAPSAAGFVRCIVTATINDKPFRALATAGYTPENILPTQTEPADFDKFWIAQKADLAKIAPDYQLTPAPDLSNEKVEVSYVSFQNVGGGTLPSRFYGVLCVPRSAGPFPAVLNVPGAGVRPYSGARSLAEKGVITLQVGIHGIPVNLPKELYDQVYRGALSNYNRFQLDNRELYYYRRVYLGCLRAADYLTTLSKWDGKNLVVMGGSQGGQLSIVTAALEPRITALAASYPAYSDVTGYLHGRAGGWPALFRPNRDGTPIDQPVAPKVTTTTYYDTVNFARRLKVPGHYFWGYNDETCPPTSIYAAYNVVTAPKQLLLALEQGHTTSPEQQALIDAWVLRQVSTTK